MKSLEPMLYGYNIDVPCLCLNNEDDPIINKNVVNDHR